MVVEVDDELRDDDEVPAGPIHVLRDSQHPASPVGGSAVVVEVDDEVPAGPTPRALRNSQHPASPVGGSAVVVEVDDERPAEPTPKALRNGQHPASSAVVVAVDVERPDDEVPAAVEEVLPVVVVELPSTENTEAVEPSTSVAARVQREDATRGAVSSLHSSRSSGEGKASDDSGGPTRVYSDAEKYGKASAMEVIEAFDSLGDFFACPAPDNVTDNATDNAADANNVPDDVNHPVSTPPRSRRQGGVEESKHSTPPSSIIAPASPDEAIALNAIRDLVNDPRDFNGNLARVMDLARLTTSPGEVAVAVAASSENSSSTPPEAAASTNRQIAFRDDDA